MTLSLLWAFLKVWELFSYLEMLEIRKARARERLVEFPLDLAYMVNRMQRRQGGEDTGGC
jgi:hypothetical protein